MKLRVLLAFASLMGAVPAVFGATNVSYTATAAPGSTPDGMDSTGVLSTVWAVSHTFNGSGSTGSYGTLLGNSATNGGGSGAGAGTSAWGLYAYGGSTGGNEIDIGHTFTGGALNVGQSVSIQFDGAYVGTGNEYGIRFYGSAGFVLSLSFVGGDSAGIYRYYDGTTSGNSAGFSYNAGGFTLKYTQTAATTYSALVTQGAATLGTFTGTVSGAPTFIQVYNDNAGQDGSGVTTNYNVYANNLAIVPEPAALLWIACGFGMVLPCLRGRRTSVGP